MKRVRLKPREVDQQFDLIVKALRSGRNYKVVAHLWEDVVAQMPEGRRLGYESFLEKYRSEAWQVEIARRMALPEPPPQPKPEVDWDTPEPGPYDQLAAALEPLALALLTRPAIHEFLTRTTKVVVIEEPGKAPQYGPAPYGPITKAPKVLIAGLRGGQMRKVTQAMHGKFRFQFWTKDQPEHDLPDRASTADHTIAVAKFLTPSHEDLIKARSADYIRVNGGISSVVEALKALDKS